MTSPSCVVIMAGGTGGHVFPALAAAEHLRAQGVDVHWLGTKKGIEARVVPAADYPIHYINVVGVRGKKLTSLIMAPLLILRALWQVIKIMKALKPACVLGMGGFVSGPGGIAAWLLGKPLIIHEQNAVAGSTNRILARFASTVLQAYPIGLGGSKARHIGNPVRSNILEVSKNMGSVLEDRPINLLVLGGSLGAKAINDLVPEAVAQMKPESRPKVWHQSGRAHLGDLQTRYSELGLTEQQVRTEAFIDDMADAYAWADLVVCRAGAMTIAELSVVGLPSILVPYPYAIDDHQTENAKWLSSQGAAVLIPQEQLSQAQLLNLLDSFNADRQSLVTMSKAAASSSKPNATIDVASACLDAMGESHG